MNELLINMSFYQELVLLLIVTGIGLFFSTIIKKVKFDFIYPLLAYIAFSYGLAFFTKEDSSVLSIIFSAKDNFWGIFIAFSLIAFLIMKSFSVDDELSKYTDNNANTGHTGQAFLMACIVMYTKFLHLSTDPYMIFFTLLFIGFIVFNLGLVGQGNTKAGEKP